MPAFLEHRAESQAHGGSDFLAGCPLAACAKCDQMAPPEDPTSDHAAATEYAGSCHDLILRQVTISAVLHGVPAEVFFAAYKATKATEIDDVIEFHDSPRGYLSLGPDSVQMRIANAGCAHIPACRIDIRIADDFLEVLEVSSVADLLSDVGSIVGYLIAQWSKYVGANNPHSLIAMIWGALQKGFAAWADQVTQTQGRDTTFHATIDAETGAVIAENG